MVNCEGVQTRGERTTMMRSRPLLYLLALLVGVLSGCSAPYVQIGDFRDTEALQREELVQRGLSFLGSRNISDHNSVRRNDCSGFVVGVYRSLDFRVELEHYNTRFVADNLYRNLRSKGHVYYGMRPRKADLAFFRYTVPNGGNRVTHVGMVTEVENDDTVIIVHYSSQGVSLMRMNLQNPHEHRNESGEVINDFLRKKTPDTRPNSLLSGELFFMYGDLYRYLTD
jgi:hypothetical protein